MATTARAVVATALISSLALAGGACSGGTPPPSPAPTLPAQTSTTATPGSVEAPRPTVARSLRSGISPGYLLDLDPVSLNRQLDGIASTGAGWIRVDFDWSAVQSRSPSSYAWAKIDRVVSGATARGLMVLALLAYTPPWARPRGSTDKYPPNRASDFARFVTAAVARYGPAGVRAWEIWNEPNVPAFWSPEPDPEAYTRLLESASTAIRQVQPDATVLTGGLAPAADGAGGGAISPQTFLTRVYGAGGGPFFTGVAVHPYTFPDAPGSGSAYNAFQHLPQDHAVMVSNGDGSKQIWVTEYGAPTGRGAQAVSEATQASDVQAAYAGFLAWPWAGPLFWYSYQDAGTNPSDMEDNFGLVRRDGSPKPALTAFDQTVHALATTP